MPMLVLSIAGFLLGIHRGFDFAIFGAAVGFCLGRLWEQGHALASLKQGVSLLQDEILALKTSREAPAAPRSDPAPAATPEQAPIPTPVEEAPLEFELPDIEAPASPYIPSPAPPPPAEPVAAKTPGSDLFSAGWKWLLGGNTLVRVGVVVLFFGLAFLIKFAAEHVTLPIEVRYIAVGIAALAALIVGWRLRDSRPDYAMPLQGLAVATFYLTLFAGYRLHGLFPAGMVFVLLVITCTLSATLAILQNARTLAIVGICGGFLAPVLASSGGGNHVALFSYYALLNAGIFGIAWFKAWRPLNVLGFLFTFGIGSFWGARSYDDALFASTEPFLLLFFFFYLGIALLYARRRHSEMSEAAFITVRGERIDYVDGTLVFGVPIAAFGLQYLMVRDMPFGTALSALGLGLVYIPLAALLYRRAAEEARLMVESFIALGVIFISLAIPLALDAQWTSAAWAAEGAGIFWVCCRQQRPVGRAFAALLQVGAAIGFLRCLSDPGGVGLFGQQAVLDGPVLGAALVGGAGIIIGRLARKYAIKEIGGGLAEDLGLLWGLFFLNIIPSLLLDEPHSALVWVLCGAWATWAGLRKGWIFVPLFGVLLQLVGGIAFGKEVHAYDADMPLLNFFALGYLLISATAFASGLFAARKSLHIPARLALVWAIIWWAVAGPQEVERHVSSALFLPAMILFSAGSALLLLGLARLLAWASPRSATLFVILPMYFLAAFSIIFQAHPFAKLGWLAWPLAFAALYLCLRRQETLPAWLLNTCHVLALWLLAVLGIREGVWLFRDLGDAGSDWPILGLALAPLVLLGLLSRPRPHWPLMAFKGAYRFAAAPLALGIFLWAFGNNLGHVGNAAPLPYLPLLNPLDLTVALSLLVLFMWLRNWVDLTQSSGRILLGAGFGISIFLWLNGILLRSLHHWQGVPYAFADIMQSTLAQSALSLFWAMLALTLMLLATRRGWRNLWLTGGGLMALVVIKLIAIDLLRVGTVERIVSFIGVGVLLLVLGYFSPVPPRKKEVP